MKNMERYICEYSMNDDMTTTKQSTTKHCAYFIGYTVKTFLFLRNRSEWNEYFGRIIYLVWLIKVALHAVVWDQKCTFPCRHQFQEMAIILYTGLILGLCPANERRCYFVTTSLIGWVQAQNQPCVQQALFTILRKRPQSTCCNTEARAPSQYKDRLIYVWWFPC